MKISKTLIAALGMASLAACGSIGEENSALNVDANLDANMVAPDMGMTTDANMTGNTAINGADGMNATENAMATDMNTNDADTNLANGM